MAGSAGEKKIFYNMKNWDYEIVWCVDGKEDTKGDLWNLSLQL